MDCPLFLPFFISSEYHLICVCIYFSIEREQEIRELHKSVAQAKDLNQQLLKQAQEFKVMLCNTYYLSN